MYADELVHEQSIEGFIMQSFGLGVKSRHNFYSTTATTTFNVVPRPVPLAVEQRNESCVVQLIRVHSLAFRGLFKFIADQVKKLSSVCSTAWLIWRRWCVDFEWNRTTYGQILFFLTVGCMLLDTVTQI